MTRTVYKTLVYRLHIFVRYFLEILEIKDKMVVKQYEKRKIDTRGRVRVPKELQENLAVKKVTEVWFEYDTEQNQYYLRWKNGR